MKVSFGKIEITAGAAPAALEPSASAPFRILVLGDLSGRASRGVVAPIAGRKPVRVDRDNFDTLPATLNAALHLALGDLRVPIAFAEIDDFHPDRLYQRLDLFRALRELRGRLSNPATFKEAAAQLRGWQEEKPAAAPPPPTVPPPPPLNPANLLEQMLGETPSRPEAEAIPGIGDWNTFLRKAVEPHLVSTRELESQAELVEMVDQIIGGQMRLILHQPRFQALEAAWKGLQMLVRRLDSDDPLQLFLFDVSKEELSADLTATEELSATGTYQVLVEQAVRAPGGVPWAVLAGCYRFGATVEDAVLLGRLAQVARRAGGPLLAEAEPALAGCRSFADSADPRDWKREPAAEARDAWQALRRLPEAASVGLIAPRFLLRLPYGQETDTIEAFPFEEMTERRHDAFLWGPAGLAGACLLGRAFHRAGWTLAPDLDTELDNLPLYTAAGEMLPCAEAWLTERGAEALADCGIMALLSVQGLPAVRLHRWQALADPPQALAGRWAN